MPRPDRIERGSVTLVRNLPRCRVYQLVVELRVVFVVSGAILLGPLDVGQLVDLLQNVGRGLPLLILLLALRHVVLYDLVVAVAQVDLVLCQADLSLIVWFSCM